MKTVFWRLAAACFALIAVLIVSAPYVTAADMTLTSCQTIQDETKLANTYGWVEVKELTGDVLAGFLSKYNAEPPVTDMKADSIHLFLKEGVAQVGVVFLLDGCVVKREFIGPDMIVKFLGAPL